MHRDTFWTIVLDGTKWRAGRRYFEPASDRVPQAELTSTLRRKNGKAPWLGCVPKDQQVAPTGGTWAVWR